jgi:hypothetical protein
MNVAMRVRVVLEVGSVDHDNNEYIVGVLEDRTSLWAGGNLSYEATLALYKTAEALVAKAEEKATGEA